LTPNQDQIDKVLDWQNEDGVDFWRAGAAGRLSRVMIPPNLQQPFETFLKNHEIDYKVHIEDVGEVEKEFESDRMKRLAAKKVKSAVDPFAAPNFSVYWTSDEIDTYSRRLATTYPQLVQREVITRSFEGRDVFALKISRGGFGRKPAVFVDGGMHAREWVSQASMMYLIYRLVEDTETSNELLQNVDWIIIPNLNPVSQTLELSTSFKSRRFSGWLCSCLHSQSIVEAKQEPNQFHLHRCRLEQKLGLHVETLGRQYSKIKRTK
jgi:carboxypeptidase A4